MKKTLKIALYALACVVGLLLLTAGVTQTQFFRDRVRAYATSELNNLLNAEVFIGELTGNLVSGFSLDSLSLYVDGSPFLAARTIDLQYNLLSFMGSTVTIPSFTLSSPQITLVHHLDGTWNFERMIRPSLPDTSYQETSAIELNLDRLIIEDAIVRLIDSVAIVQRGRSNVNRFFIDYDSLTLSHFYLDISAKMSSEEKELTFKNLRFSNLPHGFRLNKLAGIFKIGKDYVSVKDLTIATERSELHLDASLNDFDIFGDAELSSIERNPVSLRIKESIINFDELKKFLEPLEFLHGTATLDLDAVGEFGSLQVQRLKITSGDVDLDLRGTLSNLHTPENLLLSVKITESSFSGRGIAALMPSYDLPTLPTVGLAKLNLEFDGTPHDFETKFLLETPAGTFQTSGLSLSIGGPAVLGYKGNLSFKKLNLGDILGDPSLRSDLNGTMSIEGQGVSTKTLQSKARLAIDSSRIFDRPLRNLQATVDATHKSVATVVVSEFAESQAYLTGRIEYPEGRDQTFAVDGNVVALNLEDFLHREDRSSDLTFSISASGSGLTWDDLEGNFKLGVTSARYRDYSISSGAIDLSLNQRDKSNKRIILNSNIADIAIEGMFDLEFMAEMIAYQAQNIRIALGEKLVALDSTLTANVDRTELEESRRWLASSLDSVDARFSITVKDLVPVSVATSDRRFNGQGVLTGAMRGNYERLSLEGQIKLNDFFYGNADAGILIDDGTFSLLVKDLKPVDPLKQMEIRLTGDAKTLYLNRSRLDSIQLTVNYQQEYASYSGAMTFGDHVSSVLQGLARVDEENVVFTINNLGLAYKDYQWQADGGATIAFNKSGVRIDDLIVRKNGQSISAGGYIGIDGSLEALVEASSIDLDGLRYVLPELDVRQGQKSLEGTVHAKISATGTLQNPLYTAAIHSEAVVFKKFLIGSIVGDLRYQDRRLNTDLKVIDTATSRHQLTVTGYIPVKLDVGAEPTDEELAAESINLRVISPGIQMGVLDPLLPTFNYLQGILKCNLQLAGSLGEPDYSGYITVDSCSFLFVPNNIYYSFEGEFRPAKDRIQVVSTTIRNTAADNAISKKRGEFHVSGDFSLRNLTPSDFRLLGKGQVLVVKKETRRSSLSVYGNLFVEIGESGLSFTGPYQQPILKGTVFVSNSTLIFPPTQDVSARRSEYYFPAVVVVDTARKTDDQWLSVIVAYYGTEDPYQQTQMLLTTGSNSQTRTLLDNVRYDLDIQASGSNTEIQMLFDPRTDEKLVANIVGKLSITEDGRRWIGNLSIPKASYTYLNKTFNASGELVFTGDYLNPELKIEASYEGTRVLGEPLNRTEDVRVKMDISGTRSKPSLAMSMTIDREEYDVYGSSQSACPDCPKSGDVQTDAIVYILTGNFGTSQSQRNAVVSDIESAAASAVISSASSLFTQKVSDFLREQTDFINAVEFRYGQGESFSQSAEVYVNLTLYKFLVKAGGRIFESIDKSNISVLYSLGDLVNSQSLQNFMIEFEHKSEEVTSTSSRGQPVNSGRIFYRISF